MAPESTARFFSFLIFLFQWFDTASVELVSEADSRSAGGFDIMGVEETPSLKFGRHVRLLLARFTGMIILRSMVVGFSTEQELLLSRTEMGLEVWKTRKPLPFGEDL